MSVTTQSVRQPSRVYLRRGHALTNGLVAAWPMFEGAGTTVHDVTGRQLHGTKASEPAVEWQIVDGFGYQLANDTGTGTQDGVDVSNVPGFSTSTSLSVSYWTKDPSANKFGTNFLNHDGGEFVCDIENTGEPMIFTTGGNTDGTGSIVIDDGELHHVAIAWNQSAGTVKIWVDGKLSTDVSSYGDTSSANDDASFHLMYNGSGSEIVGKQGNTLYWHREITGTEARHLYRNPWSPYITKPR